MVAIVAKGLLKRERVEVTSEGDLVKIMLGNVEVKMSYTDALMLSQWIRMRAKEAKRLAGDPSHWFSVIGTLHDASITRG